MHLIDAVTHFLLSSVYSILCGAASINVFYICRDKDIQYYGSNFAAFNCSKPNEVIYVESAIIGFTPLYKADNNKLECPITADTCTKATSEPSTFCDGHIECTLAQRILQYSESGLTCNLNGSGNQGGNFINVNYSCINQDLCSPIPKYIKRYTCSTPTTSTPVASTYSFSTTEENIATSENYLNANRTCATDGSPGVENSSDALAATSSSVQETTAIGLIIGTTVAAVVLVLLLTILIIFFFKRRKRRKANQQEPEVSLAHRKSHHDTKIDKGDGGNTTISRQRSIYELAPVVINYEVVRSCSKAINQISNANEILTGITPQPDYENSKFNKEGNSNGEVFYGIVQKAENGSHIKSNDGADTETDKSQSRVISMFPPVEINTGRRDYTNCADVVAEKAIIERNVQENNGHSLSDIIEEVNCEPGNEVVLVDNALYCGR